MNKMIIKGKYADILSKLILLTNFFKETYRISLGN